MKTVAYCWELGFGNGHVGSFSRLASRFLDDGWRVALIVKDVSRTPQFIDVEHPNVILLQAPQKTSPKQLHIADPPTFGHMMLNVGYRDEGELLSLVQAWRSLFEFLEPELIVADHSPTALIASRGRQAARVVVGTGFYAPVDEYPIGPIAPWRQLDAEQLVRDEQQLCSRINRVLQYYGDRCAKRPHFGGLIGA